MAKTQSTIHEEKPGQCKPEDRFCDADVGINAKGTKEYSKETEVSENPKTTKEDSAERAGKEGYANPSQRKGAVIDTEKKTGPKSIKAVKSSNTVLPQSVDDRMGFSTSGRAFDETDLGKDLPNSYREESADIDPNQMSRSEEEELENNTDLSNAYREKKKNNLFGNNRLSDSINGESDEE